MAIDLLPPFSSMTRAHSMDFLATALCRTDSPSSSTALGSAPANSNSCYFTTNLYEYSSSKYKGSTKYDSSKTYSHAFWLAMMCTNMSNRWAKAIS